MKKNPIPALLPRPRLRFRLSALLVLGAILFFCPMPAGAEISFGTQSYPDPALNPAPSAAAIKLVKKAIRRLARDRKLANHPIRRFRGRNNAQARIIFDNPGAANGAKTINHNEIHIRSDGDYAYYLRNLVHEFIHAAIADKYGDTLNYTFLPPADYAFFNLMEEAYANSITAWLHITFPEMPSDREIRRWGSQHNLTGIADAMRNDYLARNTGNEKMICDKVAADIFNMFMTDNGTYTLIEIPRNMAIAYGMRNTSIIPEYSAFRDRSDALVRHAWNYLASMMPFQLPPHMNYDYYRGMFNSWLTLWAVHARNREDTILYWVNQGAARAALAAEGGNGKDFDYIPREDEERLNRVMKEIDPSFTPVNTSQSRK